MNRPPNFRASLATSLVIGLIGLFILSMPAWAQVEVSEVSLLAQTVEPGSDIPITVGDLGSGVVVFEFKVEDTDPQANDPSAPAIECFVVQNLGTAGPADVAQVAILDGNGDVIDLPASEYSPAHPLLLDISDTDTESAQTGFGTVCPDASGAQARWTAYFTSAFSDSEPPEGLPTVVDDFNSTTPSSPKTFKVAVRLNSSSELAGSAQNHTLRLRVLMQYKEAVGSPLSVSTFTTSITDSTPDYVWNGGINRLSELNVPQAPPSIPPGDNGVVGSFQVCDDDALMQSPSLKVERMTLSQGPNGNAQAADISSFQLFEGNTKIAELTSPGSAFNQGGLDWMLPTPTPFTIDNNECQQYHIRADIAESAMRGRSIHLNVRFTGVVEGDPIDATVARALLFSRSVIIGSGVVSFRDLQLPLREGTMPLEIQDLQDGLQRLEIQTGSVQYDPGIIQVDGITGISPYEVQSESVQIDNRRGQLRFTLSLPDSQTDSAKLSGQVASIQLHPTDGAVAGQRSIFLMQLDRVLTVNGSTPDITDTVIVSNGSITWRTPGDVDNDGSPSVRDVILLANAILNECENLTDSERISADVAGTVEAGDKAPVGKVPACSDDEATPPTEAKFEADEQKDLTSSDVSEIASLSLDATALGSSSYRSRSDAQQPKLSGWSWLSGLKGLLGLGHVVSPRPTMLGVVPSDRGYRVRASAGSAIGGLQGRIQYDPEALHVRDIEGLGGYEIVASAINPQRGEIRFVALAPAGKGSRSEQVLEIVTAGSPDRAEHLQLSIHMLLDPRGDSLAYRVHNTASVDALHVDALSLSQPDTGRWALNVQGQGIDGVRVTGFDLGGRQRFTSSARGTSLEWRALDEMTGRRLANGVYLYLVSVEGVNGQVWRSDVRKLIVLR